MERKIGILEEHCRTEGRDFREIELTLGANILIRPDVAAAEAVLAEQKAVNHITPDTDILRPEQLFLGSVDDVVERLRRYVEIGVTGFIVEMPAPFDQETLERIANDVRPRLDRIAADIG
jgi:alkanesulfonate monooxygenase SsuD/methylene tetrahydromethanopterin reductase-like flavin-dependent oxidoreductase (luciferase family)